MEMHLQLRDKQLKAILYIYSFLYQNFRATANQKSAIDTQTIRKIYLNTTLKIVIEPQEERTRKEREKKEQQIQIKNS